MHLNTLLCREEEKVLMLKGVDEAAAVTRWHLADVRFNREAAGNAPGLATLH